MLGVGTINQSKSLVHHISPIHRNHGKIIIAMKRRILPFWFEGSQGRWASVNVGLMLLLSESCGWLFRFAVAELVGSSLNLQRIFVKFGGLVRRYQLKRCGEFRWRICCGDYQQWKRKASSCCCIVTGMGCKINRWWLDVVTGDDWQQRK